MNNPVLKIFSLAALCAASAIVPSPATFAADTPTPPAAPATPPQAAQPDPNATGAGRGNRIRGGNAPDANAPGGNFQGGRGGRNFAGFGGLNLDQKQNELLREAMQADSDELRKLNDKLQAAQKALVQAVVAEKYDEKSVRDKAEAVARIQTDITVLRAKAFATVSPTLKPEQREQIENSRAAIGYITGAGFTFGGTGPGPGFQPQDGTPQFRRRGGPPGTPGQ